MENLYKINNYPSATRFYEILKENNIAASHKQVKEFVARQNIQQVKPPIHTKSGEKRIIAVAPFSQWQIDLLDYYKYSTTNKGMKYIVFVVLIYLHEKPMQNPLQNKLRTPN